jgi:hypothetical protein
MGDPPRGVFACGRVVGGKGFLVEARSQSGRFDSMVRWENVARCCACIRGRSSRLYGDRGGVVMSLLFIMGGHVKWVACAVAPLLKNGHSSRLCGDLGGVVMRLLLF